ncbi:alpha/beta fold hydrolase [Sphingomonas morindae]|uniref:Alpha/beta fold hydrolase n=1 Tax=Sphingomonas morindae TaxID=1541170 RepID=A0ABY4XE00_9SPHN|nr:alpha/beta fold hydrolase [Sphingomonas morindae]USI74946.1 alpha/beta fold hydrolase [Sphingomonas morindae]
MSPELHRISIFGSTMTVRILGSGPALLLAHGYLFDHEMWAPQIAALAARYRLILPDLWGHGGSGALPSTTRDMRDLAGHHLALLDHLGVDRCALVGLSLGGMWSAELALMAPGRVSALVLLATSLAAEPAASRDAYFGMLDLVADSGTIPPPVLATAMAMFFTPAIDRASPGMRARVAERLRAWDAARLRDSIAPLGRITFGRREALEALGALTVPTLVATGDGDMARPPAEGQAMADRIGCPFVRIPDAGHIANLEAPDFVTRLLCDFLARAIPGAPARDRTAPALHEDAS